MLPGYQVRDQIHNGLNSVVYKAVQAENQQPVILKILRRDYPTLQELTRYRREYEIICSLNLAGVVKAYRLESYQNTLIIVLEDFGGQSLKILTNHQPLTLEQFLPLAIQSTKILGGIHAAHIIHKDINPGNMVFNPVTGILKIIDFSIATQLNRETPTLKSPSVLEGTLPYLSPEQTGRMNRSLDYRSDFYSLGVTFYELLTGQVPFTTQDTLELVHCHLAKRPTPPDQINPSIPQALSNIVMRLMAKNAEDRYQSALGLKYDLEHCCQQWETTREIILFELGRNDRYDLFIIPEKLYGRAIEVQTLLAAFERVSGNTCNHSKSQIPNPKSELILVSGFSGIGKTAVVREVHKPITQQKGYFIQGKFDQFNHNLPFSAFVQAFRSLMGQLLGESDQALASWKAKILEAVGNNGQVLVDVIPKLEHIIGPQPLAPDLSGSAAQNRFNLLFSKFIRVFTTKEHPLVLFLDDLQWVDSASLNLLKVLMNESETGYLLVLGAYRDNEVFPTHPLMLTLAELEKQQAVISIITLAPLTVDQINQLVADTLHCCEAIAQPLTEVIYQKTNGNPFFTIQFLKGLYEEELISFNFNREYWECDLVRVQNAALTDNVVAFMVGRLQKLPAPTQHVLELAACIGNQFDLETLAVVCEASEAAVFADIWGALQEGFVLPVSEYYKFSQADKPAAAGGEEVTVGYHFLHDRVQQAAYSLIPSNQQQAIHLKIGQLLLHNTPATEREDKLFDIVNQLNIGVDLIAEQTHLNELAQLNLSAGRKAKASTAYGAALDYLMLGLELLPEDCWRRQYDLTLNLHTSAAEAAFLNGDFQRQEHLTTIVMEFANTLLDRVKIYEVKIQACQAQGRPLDAIQVALEILQLLGVDFPKQPTCSDVELGLAEIKLALADKTETEIITLPAMTNSEKLAAMRILASVAGSAYGAAFNLMALMGFKLVDFSLNYGNTAESALGYALYGVVLCDLVDNIEAGYQASQLALGLLERSQTTTLKAQIYVFVYDLIRHWKAPIREILQPLLEGYASGLETGNLEWAGFSAVIYCYHAYFMGRELSGLAGEIANYSEAITTLKQEAALNYQEIARQAVLNLLGQSPEPCQLIGTAYDEAKMLPLHQEAGDRTAVCFLAVNKLILCNYLGDFGLAQSTADLAREYLDGATGAIHWPIFHFHDSLVQLALFPQASSQAQTQILAQVDTNQAKLRYWAKMGPMNHLHKFQLVAAERHRVLGEKIAAMELYDLAISGAQDNKYVQEKALANELAAKFYLDWGKEKVAQVYMSDAHYAYRCWGATAKVKHLEEKYSNLLTQQPTPAPKITTHQLAASTTSASQHGDVLDFESLVRASQAISGEIVLERLLSTLMQILLENTGAQTGFLALRNNDTFTIEAIGSTEKTIEVLQSIPLDATELNGDSSRFSASIFNYVARTQESLVLRDAFQEGNFTQDPYIQTHQVKSLLCAPLLNQTQLSGIVYLENNLTVGAFTNERLEIWQLLSGQAAIAIDHARLYADLEQKVLDRTQALQDKNQELADTLDQLRSTQRQLIESEKMAALGSLVAGVAHEINTPVGTAVISASTLMTATLTIQNDWGKGNLKRSTLKNYLELASESSRLILSNLHRAGDLVQSFKQVAVDQTTLQLRTFAIKPYLEEVLANLVPQLKGTTHHFTVEGDDDLTLHSYPGAISQIVTNLVMNSLYHAYQPGEAGNLRFEIISQDPNLFIRYSDDGCGIPPENLSRVFEPFFTTGREHGGSGLGLHLVYNLVTQKLNGNIIVESALGLGATFMITLPVSVQ